MYKCKITVLKRMVNKELIDQYTGDEYRAMETVPCPYLRDAQEFWVEDSGTLPEGFCAWAWANIHSQILTIMSGGDFAPWIQPGTAIACCSDGLRPVVFKVERIKAGEAA
jgi:uncharacterized repeat protein (TIGR04076 family)